MSMMSFLSIDEVNHALLTSGIPEITVGRSQFQGLVA